MIRALEPIRHNKIEYRKNAIIEGLSASDAKRLVELQSAEYIISPEEELKVQQTKETTKKIDPQHFEELRVALDEEYNAEELTREAKAVGVDLAGATTKKAVIEAIINQGKTDELLEDDSDDK